MLLKSVEKRATPYFLLFFQNYDRDMAPRRISFPAIRKKFVMTTRTNFTIIHVLLFNPFPSQLLFIKEN